MEAETFRNQAVIITGASSGIGRALALRLADEGARLALAARCAERLDALAAECQARGAQAIAVSTDVADETQCQRLVERAVAEHGRLDMLVNNAGLSVGSLFEALPDLRLFRHVVDVNFFGAVHCAYHALPHLKATRGRIVNVSSLGGRLAIPGAAAYVASKFALQGLSDALRLELGASGVSVTVICPYWVMTEFHERLLDKDGVPVGPRGRALYTPRTMTADQCAQITLEAARRRRREVLMGPGLLGVWLRLLAPSWMDWLTVKIYLEPVLRRARAAREAAAAGARH